MSEIINEKDVNKIINKYHTEFIDDFSKEIYTQTYRHQEEDIDGTHLRMATALAENEKDKEYWIERFTYALSDFKFMPGGRIISNAGAGFKGTTLINCFVDGFRGEDQDSMEGILETLRNQALILKSEGGYGFCADVMRPRGGYVEGIGSESPGSVKMLDMWDTQSAVITAGSGRKTKNKKGKLKIRKGAQMVTMSCFSNTTEILTDLGWLNVIDIISRVKNGETIHSIIKDGSSKKIFDPIIREPEPIYEIETIDGDKIQVTSDHEFEVKNIKTGEIYLKKISDIDIEMEYVTIISEIS